MDKINNNIDNNDVNQDIINGNSNPNQQTIVHIDVDDLVSRESKRLLLDAWKKDSKVILTYDQKKIAQHISKHIKSVTKTIEKGNTNDSQFQTLIAKWPVIPIPILPSKLYMN